jgi:hypothetical protein
MPELEYFKEKEQELNLGILHQKMNKVKFCLAMAMSLHSNHTPNKTRLE